MEKENNNWNIYITKICITPNIDPWLWTGERWDNLWLRMTELSFDVIPALASYEAYHQSATSNQEFYLKYHHTSFHMFMYDA